MWYRKALYSQLVERLRVLAPQFATAAQSVYDAWEINEDGFSEQYGVGGICDDIADEMVQIIYNAYPDLESTTLYIEEPGHTYCVVYDPSADEGAEVDISPYLYEQGSYYTWKKIPNVAFDASFVHIGRMSAEDAKNIIHSDWE